LIAGGLAAFAKTVHHLAQDRGDGVADLIARRSRDIGRLTPGNAADLREFRLDAPKCFWMAATLGAKFDVRYWNMLPRKNFRLRFGPQRRSSSQPVNCAFSSAASVSAELEQIALCGLSCRRRGCDPADRAPNGTAKYARNGEVVQKGYGFIQAIGGGREVFVHISAVERVGLSSLNEGQQIEFEIEENRGKSSAVNLRAS
jgi:cold shock protein